MPNLSAQTSSPQTSKNGWNIESVDSESNELPRPRDTAERHKKINVEQTHDGREKGNVQVSPAECIRV